MVVTAEWWNAPEIKRVQSTFDNISPVARDNERVFEDVFRRLFEPLCRYANSIVKDDAIAEETVQQVFLRLWEKATMLQQQQDLKPYLYRAVYNTCINHLKHKRVQMAYTQFAAHNTLPHTHPDGTGERLNSKELEARIATAINQLPEQCRRVFEMSRFQHLTYQEIADELDISIKTVEAQMGKALKWMRTQLADYLTALPFVLALEIFKNYIF